VQHISLGERDENLVVLDEALQALAVSTPARHKSGNLDFSED